jgi:histidinol-phosphatase
MSPLDVAHLLADAADAITLDAFHRQNYGVAEKDDGSVVTDADVATESEIRRLLAVHAPDAGIIGEERGTSGVDFRRWYIDPIDGTSSFVAGNPEWATMIAFEDFERLEASVVSSPALGRRWYASHDGGAWSKALGPPTADPDPIRVSRVDSVGAARVSTWPPPWRLRPQWTSVAGAFLEIAEIVAGSVKGKEIKPTRGTGLPNAGLMVATGRLDGFLLCGGGPWDVAPLALLVQEAGGRFSDAEGTNRYDSGVALFTNGPIHDALLEWLED